MNESVIAAAERVGPAFSIDGMLQARAKARQAIHDIAALVNPGMVEENAVDMAKKVLIDSGLNLSWHPTRVRFGKNTMKAMKQASDPGVVLQDNDIFFIDIAPRFEAWEGDGGAAFVVGNNEEHARRQLRAGITRLWSVESQHLHPQGLDEKRPHAYSGPRISGTGNARSYPGRPASWSTRCPESRSQNR